MNAPFIALSDTPTDNAVLLVHGLGDSPFSFVDIASELQANGYDVYVLLLPEHGSKPSDLMLPSYRDWQYVVDHYANILKKNYKNLWLGGFSTGANLVTIHTIEQRNVAGLLLFSPGFETHSPFVEKLAPFVAHFTDWGWRVKEDNLARYRSSPLNASIAYSDSAIRVRELLEHHSVDVPTAIVMSEADSVINPERIKHYFDTRFTHSMSHMLWYGDEIAPSSRAHHKQTTILSMTLPEFKISTASHMSPLFSPRNPYYGQKGEKRMCSNSMNAWKIAKCEDGEEVWFAAWGHREAGKIFARLTWNPHFESMNATLRSVMNAATNP